MKKEKKIYRPHAKINARNVRCTFFCHHSMTNDNTTLLRVKEVPTEIARVNLRWGRQLFVIQKISFSTCNQYNNATRSYLCSVNKELNLLLNATFRDLNT